MKIIIGALLLLSFNSFAEVQCMVNLEICNDKVCFYQPKITRGPYTTSGERFFVVNENTETKIEFYLSTMNTDYVKTSWREGLPTQEEVQAFYDELARSKNKVTFYFSTAGTDIFPKDKYGLIISEQNFGHYTASAIKNDESGKFFSNISLQTKYINGKYQDKYEVRLTGSCHN